MTITYPVRNGVYVNMTNRCPCACTFCLRQHGPSVYGSDPLWLEREPTVEEVKQALAAWDLSQKEEVVFCGYGEPTERLPELLEVAAWLKTRSSIPVRINTNAVKLHSRKDLRQRLLYLAEQLFHTLVIDLSEHHIAKLRQTCNIRIFAQLIIVRRTVFGAHFFNSVFRRGGVQQIAENVRIGSKIFQFTAVLKAISVNRLSLKSVLAALRREKSKA